MLFIQCPIIVISHFSTFLKSRQLGVQHEWKSKLEWQFPWDRVLFLVHLVCDKILSWHPQNKNTKNFFLFLNNFANKNLSLIFQGTGTGWLILKEKWWYKYSMVSKTMSHHPEIWVSTLAFQNKLKWKYNYRLHKIKALFKMENKTQTTD